MAILVVITTFARFCSDCGGDARFCSGGYEEEEEEEEDDDDDGDGDLAWRGVVEASVEAVSLMCDCEVLKLVFYVGFGALV